MVKTKEAKPPQEIVDAIQASDDGSTAPPDAEVLGDTSANRVIAAKLVHEEPQKPSDLLEELRQSAASHEPMSKEDKHLKFMESQAQQKDMQYDRQHPGAGKAGRGDQAIGSMTNMDIGREPRNQQSS